MPNETVSFGDDFQEFVQECDSGRREWQLVEEPSLLDKNLESPTVYTHAVQYAIRTEQPGVTMEIGAILEAHGQEAAYHALLAPSLIQRQR